jgi:hypothetical protein
LASSFDNSVRRWQFPLEQESNEEETLGFGLIFQMLFQSISENDPMNWMLYADFAKYWPDV